MNARVWLYLIRMNSFFENFFIYDETIQLLECRFLDHRAKKVNDEVWLELMFNFVRKKRMMLNKEVSHESVLNDLLNQVYELDDMRTGSRSDEYIIAKALSAVREVDEYSYVCRNPPKGLQALNSALRSCALEADIAAIRRSSHFSGYIGTVAPDLPIRFVLTETCVGMVVIMEDVVLLKDMAKELLTLLIIDEIQTRNADVYHGMFALFAIRIIVILPTTGNKAEVSSENFAKPTSEKISMMKTSRMMKNQVKKVSTVTGKCFSYLHVRLWLSELLTIAMCVCWTLRLSTQVCQPYRPLQTTC